MDNIAKCKGLEFGLARSWDQCCNTPCGFVSLQVCRCNLTFCCLILRTSSEGNVLGYLSPWFYGT